MAQVHRLAEQLYRLAQRRGRLGFHERAKFGGGGIHGGCAERHRHALVGAERVDRDGKRRDDAVDGGLLDEQRFAAAGFLHLAVGELGDFQFGGDGLGDAEEFAGLVEPVNEIAEGIKGHGVVAG